MIQFIHDILIIKSINILIKLFFYCFNFLFPLLFTIISKNHLIFIMLIVLRIVFILISIKRYLRIYKLIFFIKLEKFIDFLIIQLRKIIILFIFLLFLLIYMQLFKIRRLKLIIKSHKFSINNIIQNKANDISISLFDLFIIKIFGKNDSKFYEIINKVF